MRAFTMKMLWFSAFVAISYATPRLAHRGPVQSMGKDSYIIGGVEADAGQFPFQGSLLNSVDITGTHTCSAVYIGEVWALSAAHCTMAMPRSVWFGIQKHDDPDEGQHRALNRIINHPNYGTGPGTFPNDISIVEMSSPVEGPNIAAATLPSSGDFAGENASISGWGATCASCGLSEELLYANGTVLSSEDCSDFWGGSINVGHICFYNGNNAICAGDGGGPLSIDNLVIGIGSWQAPGCDPAYPSAFTRITHFREWIEAITGI